MTPAGKARRRGAYALVAAIAAAAACDDGPGGLVTVRDAIQLAVVAYDPGPALWVDLEGRAEARVRFIEVADPIVGNHPDLPVTDATILALGPVKWSPDGQRLAVVTSVAYDQSEVVIVDPAGASARVASINTQVILSNVAWSPDGRRIAYTMSTLPLAQGVDVFMTDLVTNAIFRLTEGFQAGVAGVELGFDALGTGLFVTRMTGEATARMDRINLSTGARVTVADDLPGEPQAIAPNGAWVLLLRRDGASRVLVRHTIATGAELELARAPGLQRAELTARGEHALLVLGDETPEYRLVPVAGGTSERVTIDRRGSFAVDVYR